MVDTLRIIMFLKCQMRCSYCCNEQEQFNSQFKKVSFDSIDFSKYKNVCVSGGEPFLKKDVLYSVLSRIPIEKNVFIYSNALLINDADIAKLKVLRNFRALNVGLHTTRQLKAINPKIDTELPTRYMLQDTKESEMLSLYSDRLTGRYKTWKLNECNMPNEEWVLLNG